MKFLAAAMIFLSMVVTGCAAQHLSASKADARPDSSGSYLMQPPMRHGDLLASAELADWEPIAFFDDSSQCEDARTRSIAAYPSMVQVSESVQTSQRLASLSRCIAADNPRINWFHFRWKWK